MRPLLRRDVQRVGNVAAGPRSDIAAGHLDRQLADLDGRAVRSSRRFAGQHLTNGAVTDGLLKGEDGIDRALPGFDRRVFETGTRRALTIAGHIQPTVHQSSRRPHPRA